MKTNRTTPNAVFRPFKLNNFISATILVVLFAGFNAFGWGISTPQASRGVSAPANASFARFGSSAALRNKKFDLFNPSLANAAANGMFFDGIADLAISKSDSVINVNPGQTTTYVIRITNVGTATVTGGILKDTPGVGITLNSTACHAATVGNKCTVNPTLPILTGAGVPLPSMAPGDRYDLDVTATVNTNPAPPSSVTNTANIALEGGAAGNGATDTNTVNSVDLTVTKTDGSLTYTPGAPITYTMIVRNLGPNDATGVAINDTVPAFITGTIIGCTPTGAGASCGTNNSAGNSLAFANASVPTGGGIFLTLTVSGTVSLSATGNLVNTITVTPGPEPDTNLNNNSATDTDTFASAADLAVTKTDGSPTYIPGNAITYTMVVTNLGPSNATGVSISDPVPATITGVTYSCVSTGSASCGTSGPQGNNVSFTNVNIAVGAGNFLTITVNGTVSPSTTGDLVNTITVIPGNETDLNMSNNTATDIDIPAGSASLIICKQLTPNDQIPVNTVFAFTSPSFPGTINVPAGPNGAPNCSAPISVTAGNVTVTETAQTDVAVTAITASPAGRLVSANLATRTGVVSVPISLTATTITFTNQGVGVGTGYIEVCKRIFPNDPFIAPGTLFTFTVTGMVNPAPVVVPAGAAGDPPSCSPPIQVAAGQVTVTETAPTTNIRVQDIEVNPAGRLVSRNLANRTVTVNVLRGDVTNETLVTFVNQSTRTGYIEICKYALDTDVTGNFQFTVLGAPGTYSVPTGFCSEPIAVTLPVDPRVRAFTTVVTELARPTFRLEQVDTTPTGRNTPGGTPGFVPDLGLDANGNPLADNTNGGFTTVELNQGDANQMVLVNFYNRSLPGRVKVCKFIADNRIPVTTAFNFTVTGTAPTSATQTMPGTPSSATIAVVPNSCTFVPGTFIVGTTVTVTEVSMTPPTFTSGGITYDFTDIRVSSIVGNPGLVSFNLANKTATLTARNSLAEVDFTNFIFRPTLLKLCKAGGPGVGGSASFTLSLPNPLTSWAVSTAPIVVPVGGCTLINGPFPGLQGFPIPGGNGALYGTFNLGTQLTITEAASSNVLTSITSPTGNTIVRNGLAGTITLTQVPNNINEIRFLNSLTPQPGPEGAARFDFDGDGSSDRVIYRNGTWWYAASGSGDAQNAIQFGIAGDKLVAADYDGDGKTDAAVYRSGTWYVLGSTQGFMAAQFGLPTDIPQPGDFDGDGKADFAVFRPSEGVWYMQNSTAGFGAVQFGITSDKPVSADFDGDGKTDQAVYRSGTWYVLGSTAGFYGVQFGIASDIPVQADFDGDGKADQAVYRGGTWHILGSSSGYSAAQFGMASDTPVPADYDGDGKTDFAIFRPSTNVWHILRSSEALNLGGGYVTAQFGSAGDVLMNY